MSESTERPSWPGCILLVDDHADTLSALTRMFERVYRGTVMSATSCAAARATAASSTCGIDLVVGDVGLPDGDGLKLLQELKAAYRCKVVVLTGYGMPGDVERSKGAGVDLHLTKPVTIDRIRAALDALR